MENARIPHGDGDLARSATGVLVPPITFCPLSRRNVFHTPSHPLPSGAHPGLECPLSAPDMPALTLTTPPSTAHPGHRLDARVAVYGTPAEPPAVEHVTAPDPISLIEDLCDRVEQRSPVPAPALREVIENLVHADFTDAVVSVADAGHTVRISDHGPGIRDPERALLPGYTSATRAARTVVRGVGGGLPLANELMRDAGGRLHIEDNLGSGAAVTLQLPPPPVVPSEPVCSETARMIMALLLELGSARPQQLAEELGRDRGECGRELALLKHRGLVCREAEGTHRLTDAGAALLATLF